MDGSKVGAAGQEGIPAMAEETTLPSVIKSSCSRRTVHDWTGCATEMAWTSLECIVPVSFVKSTRPDADISTLRSSWLLEEQWPCVKYNVMDASFFSEE